MEYEISFLFPNSRYYFDSLSTSEFGGNSGQIAQSLFPISALQYYSCSNVGPVSSSFSMDATLQCASMGSAGGDSA